MFPWFKKSRRRRLLAEAISLEWLGLLKQRVPYYGYLSTEQKTQLCDDLRIFIAEKQWVGCGGQQITDEIRVLIAAQACLLTLNIQPTYHYDRVKSILVYPTAYRHPGKFENHGGIVSEGTVLSGEAWPRSPIVLSWRDVLEGIANPHDGYNVVFHEFAHHLDGLDGDTDGTPPLESRQQYAAWDAVVSTEYNRLVQAVNAGTPSLLREYGATNRAEFFAVATECFFERGQELKQRQPELYDVLRGFYQFDTASWPQGEPRAGRRSTGGDRSGSQQPLASEAEPPIDHDAMAAALVKQIRLPHGSADAHFSVGVARLNDKQYEQAVAAFDDAIQIDPADSEALQHRGLAHLRLGRLELAQADLDAAIRLDPKDIAAYRARAEVRLGLADFAGALADCPVAIRNDRRDATALYVRGQALAETGAYRQAVRSLSTAITADPKRAEFYLQRSRILGILGDAQRAERDRAEALRRDPNVIGWPTPK
jgi:hypothetical protein